MAGTASLSGLSSQATARQGNVLGILGVSSGILASLAAVGFPPEVLAQFAGVAAIGGTVGAIIGRRITATELPQMVAALHSVVGLAAVLTSIGSVIGAAGDHLSTLHLVTAYLGVLIGRIFFPFLACAASGISADVVWERWRDVYGFDRRFSQARWEDVVPATHAPGPASHQRLPTWSESGGLGRILSCCTGGARSCRWIFGLEHLT